MRAAYAITINALDWSTPLGYDHTLVPRLEAMHRGIADALGVLVQARRPVDPAPAHAAVARCIAAMRTLQRIESLRLYPVLDRRIAADEAARAATSAARLELAALTRRALRILEESSGDASVTPTRAGLMLARALLLRALERKRQVVFPRFDDG
ncbi:MAG TPA: hypothetical protein VFG21_03900 [Xanthomonadaceae bacterium]|nr:hypothetical protein [Xanthomonadaceae bacterium]